MGVTVAVTDDWDGEARNRALVHWERDGKLSSFIQLMAYDEHDRRMKKRVIEVGNWYDRFVKQQCERFEFDGRNPYLSEEEFARVAIAVMALT